MAHSGPSQRSSTSRSRSRSSWNALRVSFWTAMGSPASSPHDSAPAAPRRLPARCGCSSRGSVHPMQDTRSDGGFAMKPLFRIAAVLAAVALAAAPALADPKGKGKGKGKHKHDHDDVVEVVRVVHYRNGG